MYQTLCLRALNKGLVITLFSLTCLNVSAESISDSQSAIKFALSDDRVPNASTVKLEYMKMMMSDKAHQWTLHFRDADKKYEVLVNAEGRFQLNKKFDEDGENATFWQAQPDALTVATTESFLEKAKATVSSFNPTFTPQNKALVEYFVCKPAKKDTESKYTNGCSSKEQREWWEVSVQIKSGEETFYRKLDYQHGLPVSIAPVSVYGNW